jgi:hypothetical protein
VEDGFGHQNAQPDALLEDTTGEEINCKERLKLKLLISNPCPFSKLPSQL